jgi:beta-phosphoglucomutase-like phosphatase (HAD superfamily)
MNRVTIFDVDGTLVDTNYQHALAWYRAFRDHEIVLPIWQIHRRIGMGGDQLVEDLTDSDVEARLGDQIRRRQSLAYGEMMGEVAAFEGATELLRDLHEDGHTVILSSSAREEELAHYLDLLQARDVVDSWISAGDVAATNQRRISWSPPLNAPAPSRRTPP